MAERTLTAPAPSRIRPLTARAWVWTMELRPLSVLGLLAVVQWLALLALIVSIHHNGWLFYQGGDETFYYTTGWGIAGGHLPPTSIGYGWSLLLAPIALFAGPSYLAALPGIVLLQVLVLLPLGLWFAYGLGERLAGRWLGYTVAVGWVVAPYLVIPGFVQRFHAQWVEQFLPQALGLTGLADFVSMVVVTGAVWLFLRALDSRAPGDALLAGLITGLAIGIKPANVLFVAGPGLALLATRRWRTGLLYGVAIAPAALTLAVWKERGLGHLPLLAVTVVHVAGAATAAPLVATGAAGLHAHWTQLGNNLAQLREFFWSMRLIEWLPFAGFVALARVSWPKALVVGGWLAAFILVKGTSSGANVQDATFFRLLMPAWPAYLVLVASLPLLVPDVARAVRGRVLPAIRPIATRGIPLVAAAALLGFVPLVAVAALPTLQNRSIVSEFTNNVVVPAGVDFHLRARATPKGVELTWRRPAGARGAVFYRLYSEQARYIWDRTLTPVEHGIACLKNVGGARRCRVLMNVLGTTEGTTYLDRGRSRVFDYRVGLAANWLKDPSRGDVLMLSRQANPSLP
ncbi:MAG: hypothetical protein ABR569_01085 [Gaiellaceae bacterium]